MKKFLLALAVLCLASSAFAFENAGGTLFAHNGGITEANSNGAVSMCLQGTALTACESANVEIDGATPTATAYFKVYAAFPLTSSPRLMGVAWGITASTPVLVAGGTCGDFELPDAGWPAGPFPLGNSVTWNTVQQNFLTPVYWFRGYGGGAYAGTVDLGPNPSQNGVFGNDNVPAQLDPIYAFGKMGFDHAGLVACPYIPPQPGACCMPDGTCLFILQADCTGIWHGGVDCTTYQCPLPTGSCCAHDGTCTVTLAAGCAAPAVWTMFANCTPNVCAKPTGACCQHSTGACEILTAAACAAKPTSERWVWLGMDSICDPVGCNVVPTQQHSWGQIKHLYR